MHCCKKLAVRAKVQQICVRRTQRMIDIYVLKKIKSKDRWRERLQRLTVGMLEWWRRECALTAELPCLGMPPRYTEKTEMWEFLKNLVDQKKREKSKDRCQDSAPLHEPNVQTAAVSSFHPFTAEILMRSLSRVCPDHRFLPQPVTYLSTLIEFTGIQSASFSCSSSLSVLGLSERRAATHLPVCLQTFYITASALVKPEHASTVTGRRKKKKRDSERIES